MLPVKYDMTKLGAKWLWLDPAVYSDRIKSRTTVFAPGNDEKKFTAVEFRREMQGFGKGTHKFTFTVFADTKFQIYVNGKYVGEGPVAAGGDYGNTLSMPVQYVNKYTASFSGSRLIVRAVVHTSPEVMTDYSCGRGGFILAGDVDGWKIGTDSSWGMRVLEGYHSVGDIDLTVPSVAFGKPYVLEDDEIVWNTALADLEMVTEEEKLPVSVNDENGSRHFVFDRIYSAYITASINNKSAEPRTVRFGISERDPGEGTSIKLTVPAGITEFRSLRIYSVSEVRARAFDAEDNLTDDVKVDVKLSYVHYPVDHGNEGAFVSSDEKLNGIYDVGKFTLEMCRQSLHLDSPEHQETLGCTGDYAIEALMTRMTFGDMRVAGLDVIRTADYMKMTDGYMFHTSYSLIWVDMLYEYYMYTADIDTVKYCAQSLGILLSRFAGYVGEHGVVEKPLNYMFIDWANIDGFQMHHPPMSLGQTSLNAFYYNALVVAAKIYTLIGDDAKAEKCAADAAALKQAFRKAFYVEEKKCFRDGFTKAECDYEANGWLPANTEKTYYTRHCNILAVCYGLVDGDEAKELISRCAENERMDEDTYADVQPYFMFYMFEALRKTGLFEKYGIKLIRKWEAQIEESPKGMKEGWGEFRGDRSHAWGASPTYYLPMMISGFELTEPGFTGFRLSPNLMGLEKADIVIPSPYGKIEVKIAEGKSEIIIPEAYEMTDGVARLKETL